MPPNVCSKINPKLLKASERLNILERPNIGHYFVAPSGTRISYELLVGILSK